MYNIGYEYNEDDGYAITINNLAFIDIDMANILKMSYENYLKILKKNGARKNKDSQYYFKREDDIIAAIIMFKLMFGG